MSTGTSRSTSTTTGSSGPAGGVPRLRPGRVLVALAAVLLLAAAPAAAQEECDESAGTLGIQGLRCEGCTYSMSQSGIEAARFRTEPQVLAVARGFAEGDRLRAGDRIVAIDGTLITTREGSDRLVELGSGQSVTVRVRRNGRELDLEVVAGSACELVRQARQREVEVERMDERELPPGYQMVELPPAPPAEAPLPPAPPAGPRPPVLPPSGYLGFGLRCERCGIRSGAFFFASPPTIIQLTDDGPAAEAGLRSGDVILEVDGRDITGAGADRFGEIEPGQTVRLTVRRDGQERAFTVEAVDRPTRPAAMMERPAVAPPRPFSERLRFEGRLGGVEIEIRGAPVTVTRDEAAGELVIRAGGTVIRLKDTGG